ncbi:hypothetical protein GJV85_08130 [Sulfurimonas aquatica]|uniref:Uncharacterized protein n=1 Tax=Sulfurimonas aquatica TaxID=2672570 RepID=A0A975B0N9_9BACT|nr:hypothetical protein [Sulfurimonas aquatica]QSZ42079.1 hypothetical protein GJV85_08130 [Sulfurimonas aquatica]
MKYILQFLTLLFVCFTPLLSNDYQERREISLQKDEQKKILVKYANYTKEFKFRWTLYTNEGLVVLRSYNKRVAQNILYLNNTNQSFKVYLKAKGAHSYETPYLLVKFKEFDIQKDSATFELFLSDRESQINLQDLKNN